MQLQELQSRIKYLEGELSKSKNNPVDDRVDSPGALRDSSPSEVSMANIKDINEIEPKEEFIDPFGNQSEIVENDYFGTSSCHVFDNSLSSYLSDVTHKKRKLNSSNQLHGCRYFFPDSTVDKPFTGVMILPDKKYVLSLIKKTISFIGYEYYLFDSPRFLKYVDKVYDPSTERKPLFLCYLLVTLAVGEQYLNESSDGGVPGMRFFVPALQLYKNYYESPSLDFVQTLLLMAFYQQGLNRSNGAFSFYGLAIRTSLIMGLHRKVTDSKMTPIEKEKRRRVWWTAYVMESIWCAKLGQPIHISIEDTDVEFPGILVKPNDSFNCTLLLYNAKLSIIIGTIMKKIYRPVPKGINLKSIMECLDELDSFQEDLPADIKESFFISGNRSTANLYLRLNQIVIITTRPLLLSIFKGLYQETQLTKKVTQKCIIAAKTTIDILSNLKDSGWFSTFGFWDAQYCFSALLILIMTSFNGNELSQIKVGRRINGYMRDAGNFTAMENEIRLKELDQLLERVEKSRSNQDVFASASPNINLLMAEISNNFTKNDSGEEISNENDAILKNNLSPDTWESLVLSLQFWDSNLPYQ